jgi:hypothetical protein
MRFVHLFQAVSTGLLQQIPIVGPVLQSILAERSQAVLEQRLVELLQQLADSRQTTLVETNHPTLVPTLLMAEAEVEHRLERSAAPQHRFLYLAADEYASSVRTYEIVVQYSFLWRSFHKDKANKQEAIAKVGQIAAGDVIALGYRANKSFRLLLPLVVLETGPYTVPIDTREFPNRNYSPFVWANDTLSQVLQKEGYGSDPVFRRQTGVNVRPLFAEVSTDLQGSFPSPGIGAIWSHDHPHVPAAVRDWIASL